ncbi:MAG: patatin-like phospholipase family protein, partial [Muribaculaceae bacterium]|nr:patatin-like phospholipase family protein [Muribaculaceae bacterium]
MAEDSTKPFRIGVALSGGGARGLAHAGALKALEEAGYHPDIIAGVSAGSVAAVLYAAGVKPDRILELFARSKFSDLCRLKISGRGILDMTRFRKLITRTIAPVCDIRELRIPTY